MFVQVGILQGEIRCLSLLELKGLRDGQNTGIYGNGIKKSELTVKYLSPPLLFQGRLEGLSPWERLDK